MPNITISVPEELKKQLDNFPEMNWSEILRSCISEKVKRLEILRKLDKAFENSTLTEEDCLRLGNEVKQRAWEKLKKEGW
jgi:hypothetical protein